MTDEPRTRCKVCDAPLPPGKSRYCSRPCRNRRNGWQRARRRGGPDVPGFLARVSEIAWLTDENAERAEQLVARGWRALRRPDGRLLAVGLPLDAHSTTREPHPDSVLAREARTRGARLRAAREREAAARSAA